jgi:hypothetical protein
MAGVIKIIGAEISESTTSFKRSQVTQKLELSKLRMKNMR